MNLETQLEILVDKLRLPTSRSLQPWLAKLLANPGSVVIIAVESPLGQDGPRIGITWLSEQERLKVRKALFAINSSRIKKDQPETDQLPN